ncbi:MAG: fluoride efflux transporter CrcB [Cyclobacteriaceae bacterium]|nr:fluoride efflux transporter CrcB [Cyclobacteriaceae bacterium]
MIKDVIWVGIGGFVGSVGRYLLNIALIHQNWPLPWPTLFINLSGSMLIGVLMAITYQGNHYWRLLLVTGFCGGFTTFSTFSYENLRLWQEGHGQVAFLYSLMSLLGGIAGVAGGFYLTQKLLY